MPARDAIREVRDRLGEFRAIQIHVPNDERDDGEYEKDIVHRAPTISDDR